MAEQLLELPTPWGRLAGTLLLPQGRGPWPAVLLIAGSGPTDRDGNNPLLPAAIDNLKRLAQELAGRGIASLRYDKRGVGASLFPGLSEESLDFEHLVDDAVVLARWMQADARVANLTLVGHSEGALVAALAAAAQPVRGVVSIAGAGRRASEVIREQLQRVLPPDDAQEALAVLATLESGQRVEEVPEALFVLFRPTVQPYMISWFRHDPPQVLAHLHAPVLLVHGSVDRQVGVDQAQALHAGRPDARLKIVPGMNHLLGLGNDIAAGTRVVAQEVAQWMEQLDVVVAAD
jgi:pimeloyl-ACP methyl ester carboxylesterase